MSHPIVQQLQIVAAVSNGVALSQTLGAAGNLTLNGSLVSGGVATLDSGGAARRLIITSAGDDSALTWTITGTKRDPGNSSNAIAATETLAGAAAGASAMSLTDFLTVTQIAGSGATTGAVTAGTNGVASAPAVPLDNYEPLFEASAVAYVTSGTPTYQLEVTYDDVYGTWLQAGQPVVWMPWQDMVGKTTNAQTILSESRGVAPVRAARWTLTAVGGIRGSILQQRGPV